MFLQEIVFTYNLKNENRILPYNSKLKDFARELRKNSTYAEIELWKILKGKQMHGYDFHRQKPIDNYIVDFYCPELKLAIEVDGSSHIDQDKKDKVRQDSLEKFGICFLRFTEKDVLSNLEGVWKAIDDLVINLKSTHPLPPLKRGKKCNTISSQEGKILRGL